MLYFLSPTRCMQCNMLPRWECSLLTLSTLLTLVKFSVSFSVPRTLWPFSVDMKYKKHQNNDELSEASTRDVTLSQSTRSQWRALYLWLTSSQSVEEGRDGYNSILFVFWRCFLKFWSFWSSIFLILPVRMKNWEFKFYLWADTEEYVNLSEGGATPQSRHSLLFRLLYGSSDNYLCCLLLIMTIIKCAV